MGPEINSLKEGFSFLLGPLERSSTLYPRVSMGNYDINHIHGQFAHCLEIHEIRHTRAVSLTLSGCDGVTLMMCH